MARPRKNIDPEQFKKLCSLQCTLDEIAGYFECSIDTIENWCKRELNARFSDVYKKYSDTGKISLRRYQLKLAEKNAAMAIFLGKQYLGQRDNVGADVGIADPVAQSGFLEALGSKAAEDWNEKDVQV